MRPVPLNDGDGAALRGRRRHNPVQSLRRVQPILGPVPTRHPKSGSVPIELSSFIGREAELAQLAKIQTTTRLLTLVGPGGVGKSRLALRLASASREMYADGTWFVEFAGVTDSGMVPQTVANAIGARERPAESVLDAVARTLRARRVLLIFDNCEHLVASCSELAAWLLRTCPALDIIATSREPLDAVGDILWRVPPLSLPSASARDAREVATSEAVQLFVERAQASDFAFRLTESNMHQVVAICRGLDGLPLALELVAARVGSMHESEIAERLGLDLVSRPHGLGEPRRRHALRATLDWSYQLLAEVDRLLLRRLSVFADGWTLKAAEEVCADETLPKDEILESLGRLVARSLVMFDRKSDSGTYYLLETVKQYARERLDQWCETSTLRRRHLAYVLALAERELPELRRPAHGQLLVREQENIRTALAWAVADNDSDAGLRLAVAAVQLWDRRLAEGRMWLERLLAQQSAPDAPVTARARAWFGHIAMMQGDYAAAESALQEALLQHTAAADLAGEGLALLMLGNVAVARGDLVLASELLDEAMQRMAHFSTPGAFRAIWQSAVLSVELGDPERAAALAVEALQWQRRHKITSGVQLFLQGLMAASRGQLGLAEGLLGQALNVALRQGEHHIAHEARRELGQALLDLGRLDEARSCLAQTITEDCAFGEWPLIARNLEAVARCLAPMMPAAAVRLAAAADGLRASRGAAHWPSDNRRLAAWLPEVQRRLKGSVYMTAWQSGRLLSADEAVMFARGLVASPGEVHPRRGESLTRREREVLTLLASALSNQQIASELNISVATTRTHVDHILAKLEMHSRAQVAVWANEHGIWQSSTDGGRLAKIGVAG